MGCGASSPAGAAAAATPAAPPPASASAPPATAAPAGPPARPSLDQKPTQGSEKGLGLPHASPQPPQQQPLAAEGSCGDEPANGQQEVTPPALASASAEAAQPPRERRHVSECAVSLAYLKRFYAEHVAPRPDADTVTTEGIKNDVILKLTEQHQCRYVDVPGLIPDRDATVGLPAYFISHAWRNPFKLLVDCVVEYLKGAVDTEVRVWVDIFAVDQHTAMDQDLQGLHTAIGVCTSGTLVVLDAVAEPIRRSWCLYEFINTIKLKSIDKLGFLGSSATSKDKMAEVFLAIDVEKAECYDQAKRVEILNDIISEFKTAEAFNNQLKLMLLLSPIDCSPDVDALMQRVGADARSQFSPQPVWDALQQQHDAHAQQLQQQQVEREREVAKKGAKGKVPPAMVCIEGSSGSGKSAVSAALCSGGGGAAIHAYHYFKHNDRRRQEPNRVVMSVAYQLALAFPELQQYYCGLSVEQLLEAEDDLDAAFDALLLKAPLPTDRPMTILLDGLDEAEMRPGAPSVATNLGYQVLKRLAELPSNLNIVVTTRPNEPPRLMEALQSKYPGMATLHPEALRDTSALQARVVQQLDQLALGGDARAASSLSADALAHASAKGGNAMVYLTVLLQVINQLQQAGASSNAVKLPLSLDEAYSALFDAAFASATPEARQQAHQLLCVLMAAQEPLSLSMLAAMGVRSALDLLPPGLFFPRNYIVYALHKSVHDWLLSAERSGAHHVDVQRGHFTLATYLVQQADAGSTDAYVHKYMMAHLAASPDAASMLERVLEDHGFIQRAFQQGHGPRLVRDLALAKATSPKILDRLRWLQYFSSDLQDKPDQVLAYALSAPVNTYVFKHAEALAAPQQWRTLATKDWAEWPPLITRLRGHRESFIKSLALNPAGTLLASCGGDRSVRLWDTTTYECVAVLDAGQDGVFSVAFSHDGTRVVTGGEECNTVCLWDAITFELIVKVKGHTNAIGGLAFTLDDARVVSASSDKTIRVWDATTMACLATLEQHKNEVMGLAMRPDGSQFATCDAEGVVCVWDATTHACVATFNAHTDMIFAIAYSPDSSKLATCCQDSTVRVWDATTHEMVHALGKEGEAMGALSVGFSADGKQLLVCAEDVRMWDTATYELKGTLSAFLGDKVMCAVFMRDGGRLATCGIDGLVRVWDAAQACGAGSNPARGALDGMHIGGVKCMAFSPDGARYATGGADMTARIWDTATHKCLATLAAGEDSSVEAVIWSSDGKRLATTSRIPDKGYEARETLRVWDTTTFERTATIDTERPNNAGTTFGAFYPTDNTRLVAGGREHIRIWDTATSSCVAPIQAHKGSIDCLAISPDGTRLVTCGERKLYTHNQAVILWDAATVQELATLEPDDADVDPELKRKSKHFRAMPYVICAAVNPDGTLIAGGMDAKSGIVYLWSAATHERVGVLRGPQTNARCLAFSPDGKRLAVSTTDKTLRVWDTATCQCVATLHGHQQVVWAMTFAPDGNRLITCSGDMRVRVWDAAAPSGASC